MGEKKQLWEHLTPSAEIRTFMKNGVTATKQTSCKNTLLVRLSQVPYLLDKHQSC